MQWTYEKPQAPGFYWHIRRDIPEHAQLPGILEIRLMDEGLRVYEPLGPDDYWHPLNEYGGQWAGPLRPPAEEEA